MLVRLFELARHAPCTGGSPPSGGRGDALHDVEEQCCDAWVIWAFPEEARTYAETLLDTVDFRPSVTRISPSRSWRADSARPIISEGD